jgi:hypothetical protein
MWRLINKHGYRSERLMNELTLPLPPVVPEEGGECGYD